MKRGIIIADSGPIFSLATIEKLDILNQLFDDVRISEAVWNEISLNHDKPFHTDITNYFKEKVCAIKGFNDLTFVMDYGESESVILYKELEADYLLLDDKKARMIAENLASNALELLVFLELQKSSV